MSRIHKRLAQPTADEIVATLKRSSLPTLLTEGRDDYAIFRRLEDAYSDIGLSVMSVGGKSCLLEIFDRRDEIVRREKTAFFADKDLWVITGVPEMYLRPEFICTEGYSIENDLYVDGELEDLLHSDELKKFQHDLSIFMSWYAFAMEAALSGASIVYDYHPSRVLDGDRIDPVFAESVGFIGFSQEMYDFLMADYRKLLRGKSLMNLLVNILSDSKRHAKHSKLSLLEYGVARRGSIMGTSFSKIGDVFKT